MRLLILFLAVCVALAAANTGCPVLECPGQWRTVCRRALKQFTVNQKRQFCEDDLNGYIRNGYCHVDESASGGITGNGCCEGGK